jgi:hypothetical protein
MILLAGQGRASWVWRALTFKWCKVNITAGTAEFPAAAAAVAAVLLLTLGTAAFSGLTRRP